MNKISPSSTAGLGWAVTLPRRRYEWSLHLQDAQFLQIGQNYHATRGAVEDSFIDTNWRRGCRRRHRRLLQCQCVCKHPNQSLQTPPLKTKSQSKVCELICIQIRIKTFQFNPSLGGTPSATRCVYEYPLNLLWLALAVSGRKSHKRNANLHLQSE